MVEFKLVVSDPKTTKSEVIQLKDANAQVLVGRRIGDVVDATTIGSSGKIMITGGSDRAGFPMRADVLGGGKNYVLMSAGVGFHSKESGAKKRRLVRGSTVTEEIYQINAKKVEDSQAKA
ncbi:MAG TPA: 30S ribosomal protein S6e [Nitrososphaerales archaeon]|nr:30S ribosomal protein S6e [Nitrososphaerales archaeon]